MEWNGKSYQVMESYIRKQFLLFVYGVLYKEIVSHFCIWRLIERHLCIGVRRPVVFIYLLTNQSICIVILLIQQISLCPYAQPSSILYAAINNSRLNIICAIPSTQSTVLQGSQLQHTRLVFAPITPSQANDTGILPASIQDIP